MINITPKAVERFKLNGQIAEQEIPQIRVYIQGSGCSGFKYQFEMAKKIEEEDLVFEHDGVRIVVDPLSYQYLRGSTIDHTNDPFSQRFIVNNPNATGQCGCGESFSI